mmetsp:Transcript_9068/g.14472  ORF Transcript_9068/g.14472 Transcript_9068/m.14472 type:complete len:425 (-) Transcript_9068:106-1380(-)
MVEEQQLPSRWSHPYSPVAVAVLTLLCILLALVETNNAHTNNFIFVEEGSPRNPPGTDRSLAGEGGDGASFPSAKNGTIGMNLSQNCLVTMVTGSSRYYALGALVLAHSFRKFSRLKPRAKLVIITDLHTDPALVRNTSVVGLWDEYVQFPDLPGTESVPAMQKYRNLLFKINAWRLADRCKRVLWMGTDSIPITNIDEVFSQLSTLAGAPDPILNKFHRLSPIVNGDFLVFDPSESDFAGLVATARALTVEQMEDWKEVGPQDQGVVNRYFNSRIFILPWYYSVEIPFVLSHLAKAVPAANAIMERGGGEDDGESGSHLDLAGLGAAALQSDPFDVIAAEQVYHYKQWKTLHFAQMAFKPWVPKRGKVPWAHQKNMRVMQYVYGMWDDLCVEMLIRYPAAQRYVPIGPGHCLPEKDRKQDIWL